MNGVLDPLPGRIHALRAWNLLRRPRIVLQQHAWDGALRAICVVARLAQGASHEPRLAPSISSRKASVATARDLIRGSLEFRGA